jgi:hypothetical protein
MIVEPSETDMAYHYIFLSLYSVGELVSLLD